MRMLPFLIAGSMLLAPTAPHSEREQPTQVRDSARTAYDAVDSLVRAHRYEEAEALARRLLAEAEQTGGLDSLAAADALDGLVWALYRGGKGLQGETRQLADRAVGIKERLLGVEHIEVAFSLNALGRIVKDRGELPEARRIAMRVVAIREKILGSDDVEVAKALNNLATVEARLGQWASARSLYDRVLGVFQKAGAPERPEQETVLNNLALLLLNMGDYEAARPLFDRVVSIQEKALGPEASELGGSLGNLCRLLRESGSLVEARRVCERSLKVWQKDPGPETGLAGSALANLAGVLMASGEVAAARPLVEHALRIREKNQEWGLPATAANLHLLGEILLLGGDLQGARSRLEESVLILERALPPGHPDLGVGLKDLGEAQMKLGDYPAAWNNALRAEEIARGNLREVAGGLGERQAIQYAATQRSAIDLVLSLLVSKPPGVLPADTPRRSFDEVVRSRAMVLDETAGRHRAATDNPAIDVSADRETLALARGTLSRLIVSGGGGASPGDYQRQLERAREGMERAERDLAARSAGFRRRLTRASLGLEEVAAALPGDSALVAYIRYNRLSTGPRREAVPSYLAFVLSSRESEPKAVALGDAEAIDATIRRWRTEAGSHPAITGALDGTRSYRDAASALRKLIWDPVADRLGAPQLVFVVPDGVLNLVNLATLPAEDERYLVETGPLLHYLSAERDLVRDEPARRPGTGLLAFGGPDFDVRPAAPSRLARSEPQPGSRGGVHRGPLAVCPDFRSLEFEPLNGSMAEVEEVESLWPNKDEVSVLTGSRAGEAALKELAPKSRIVHLATHGFFFEMPCEPAPTATGSVVNPLLLSGLALAGANLRYLQDADGDGEDGILTSEEIASLDLSGTEWVVLSACETGLGRVVSGEGVLGLRRAFEVAGAATLIMSLWSVEDDATRVWMHGLYEARLRGRSTAEAVRSASRGMIELQRRRHQPTHPFFWGGFLAAGDWR